MYGQIAKTFSKESRLEFDIGESASKTIDIAGFKILVHHGDMLMGQSAGKGIGGLAVPFIRLAKDKLPEHDADFLMIGHYHRYGLWNIGGVNGSMCGVDEYAYNRGLRSERPAQVMFQVDHEYRRIGTVMPIWVD